MKIFFDPRYRHYGFTISDVYGFEHTRSGFRTETLARSAAIYFDPYN